MANVRRQARRPMVVADAPQVVRQTAYGERADARLGRAARAFPDVDLTLSLPKFVFVFVVIFVINLAIIGPAENRWISWYLTIVWSLYLPIAIVGLAGALRSRGIRPSRFQGTVPQKVIFFVPTVCRDDTVPALRRVVDSILLYAPANLTNFRVDIVVDEGAEAEEAVRALYRVSRRVRVVTVPVSYAPPNGTRFKARANQYACDLRALEGEHDAQTFVYHLDDDTAVGPDTVAAIAEFIDRDEGIYHIAQGVLTFPHSLSPSLLCRLADSVRPSDDLTRFYFFTGMMHQPLGGLHGEHLLIRANIEDEIGWDFGPSVKVEDAYFALTLAERYPGSSTFLNGCTYGASPASVRDLITQRRRWAAGLFGLIADRTVSPRVKGPLGYAVMLWMSGPLQHILLVLPAVLLISGRTSTSPVIASVLLIWCLNFTYQIWVYLEGLRINLAVSSRSRSYPGYALLLIGTYFLISAIEGWSVLRGTVDFARRVNTFDVISKRR